MMRKLSFAIVALLMVSGLQAQDNAVILDRVVAVVGDFEVLQSDIEQQFLQIKASDPYISEDVKCEIFNYFIEQKLLMNQAKIDSIEVSPGQVELSMESRLQMFIQQIGSEEEMEEYFNKSIFDIREDLRKTMHDMMMTQQVEQSITGEINVTPSEVKAYFKTIDTDSIPYIDAEAKIAQIIVYPKTSEDATYEVRKKLLDLRERIMNGENFATLAILYSDGPSAPMGGEIGFGPKNDLDPAYASAAWALKKGQVSKIVESEFGFHIIQLIDRKGDLVNTRHIVMMPKVDALAKANALQKLDSLRTLIVNDSIPFEIAAIFNSEDKKTSVNGGLLVNPMTNAATFELNQLETKDYYIIREMEIGDVSKPYETTSAENQKLCYKTIKLISMSEPHRANLKQDYLLLQQMALGRKKQNVIDEWNEEKKGKTYIKIDPSFKKCGN